MDTSPSDKTVESAKVVPLRVGEKIRAMRTKLGLTQAQLAAPELSVSYISAIERGKIRPAVRALYFIAKRLDVPISYLLESLGSDAEAESTSNPRSSIVEET